MSATTDIVFVDDTPALTQAQRIDFYKKSIAAFGDDGTQQKIKDLLFFLANEAMDTEKSFRNIKDKFNDQDLVKDFPDITKFASSWDKLYERWRSALHESQNYASATAANYKDNFVGIVLELVSRVDLDDKKDVNKQLERLERFSKEAPPPEIPAKYEEAFSSLKHDVTYFKGQFDEYAEVQGQATAEKIKKIERELKTLEDQLTKLNKQDWTKALAITSWVPMIASYIADIGLQIVTKRRDGEHKGNNWVSETHAWITEQAQKVKTKTDELAQANKDQVALKKLVTDLSVAEHNFDEISTSLVLLSKIWSDIFARWLSPSTITQMHSMAQKLATLLKAAAEHKGKDQEEFELALKAAQMAATPLYDSLITYATVIGR
ncbi:hypothetical protein H0H81_009048 [Sphagnurus paluster]|uniref:Uncharacterized protein n=1 Tax=Sphagnurus paluster TaxID=117069 RepID=A0A9P7K2X9_9AGAR|nr:hypothetical protein H0H81_009048 [Sphagnurus paluster]